MKKEKSYYTSEGLARLNAILHKLKTEDRIQISKQIGEAVAKGDLRENAEYHAAKEAQGLLEMKIAELANDLIHAEIIDKNNIDTSTVSILNKVKIKNTKNSVILTYTLVSMKEANLKEGKISINSPIGKGLLSKKVGDIVIIKIPAGELELEILNITI